MDGVGAGVGVGPSGCLEVAGPPGVADGVLIGTGVTVGVGTGFLAAFTLILQTAFTFLLLLDVAVIFAEPAFFAVTTPVLLTVAMLFLLDFQVTFLFAFAGLTFFTLSLNLLPAVNVFFLAFKVIFFAFGAASALGAMVNAEASRAKDKTTADALCSFFFMATSHDQDKICKNHTQKSSCFMLPPFYIIYCIVSKMRGKYNDILVILSWIC